MLTGKVYMTKVLGIKTFKWELADLTKTNIKVEPIPIFQSVPLLYKNKFFQLPLLKNIMNKLIPKKGLVFIEREPSRYKEEEIDECYLRQPFDIVYWTEKSFWTHRLSVSLETIFSNVDKNVSGWTSSGFFLFNVKDVGGIHFGEANVILSKRIF